MISSRQEGGQVLLRKVGMGFLGLLLVMHGPAAAQAQTTGNSQDFTTAGDDSEQEDTLGGALTLLWRGWQARALTAAFWRRFSPERRALLTPDSPWLRNGGLGGRASPVSAQAGGPDGWGLWLESAPARMRNLTTTLRGRGYTFSHTMGLDRALTKDTTLGLSFAHAWTRTRTLYNNGVERTNSYTLGLYFSHQIAPWLSFDAQGGYVHQRQKMRRSDAFDSFWGKRSSNGFHVSGALNAWKWIGAQTMVSGRLGLIATRDRWRAYTDHAPTYTTDMPAVTQGLVQGVVEVGASWWLDPIMPYARIGYTRDLYRRNITGSTDRDDLTLSGGLLWYGSGAQDGLSLDIGGHAIIARKQQRRWGVNVGLKWSW